MKNQKSQLQQMMSKITQKHLFLLTLLFFSLTLQAQITVRAENETLRTVMKKIESQTDFTFFYNEALRDLGKKVTCNVTNSGIENVLNQLLKDTNLAYSIQGKTIAITVKEKISPIADATAPQSAATDKGRRVTGVVKDGKGETLIGVAVTVKGTSNRAATNIDGEFELQNVPSDAVLDFTYVGMKSQSVPLAGKTAISVVMADDTKLLDEVVVTAMGIERKSKSLTYATQKMDNDELMRVQDANFINSLQGKAAGLSITPNAGGAGGSSKILLRGNKSVLGNNTPLIVVDGVPMSNPVKGQQGIQGGLSMGYNFTTEGSDALSSINPDDIENINILKGANAAALYGSAASNGVLMITTKKGQDGKLTVGVTSNATFENPLLLPQLQNIYGADVNTFAGTVAGESWGKKMSEMTAEEMAVKHLTNSPQDFIGDFFKTGTTFNNSVSISGGSKNVRSYFSYGNTNSGGMIENNKFNRHTISFRQNYSIFEDRLKIDASINYVNQSTRNRPGGGTSLNPLFNLYTSPRNMDMNYYRNNYKTEDGTWMSNKYDYYQLSNRTYIWASGQTELKGPKQNWVYTSADQNNPYWLLNMINRTDDQNRVYGYLSGNIKLMDGLNAQARFSIDRSNSTAKTETSATTQFPSTMLDYGEFRQSINKTNEFYLDWMLNYNKEIGKVSVSASAGYTAHQITGDNQSLLVGRATVEDPLRRQIPTAVNIFDPRAGITGGRDYDKFINWDEGLFFTGQIGYNDYLFLEGSYRQDWYRAFKQFSVSRGTPDNYGYFSLGVNALMHDIVELPKFWDYLKLRTSYSEVGNSIPNVMFSSVGVNLLTGASTPSPYAYFENPVPEKTKSLEAGFDVAFFKNSLMWDVTLYHSTMNNNYLLVGTSGKQKPVNSGVIRNMGVETTLTYAMNLTKDLLWKTGVNFAYNNNKILKTYKDKNGNESLIEQQIGFGGKVQIKYREGGSYGDLYVTDFARDENGKIKLSNEGKPGLSSEKFGVFMGNMNAPYQLGWNNTFTYKGFSLYFLADGRIGGKVISFTQAFLDFEGLSTRSGEARQAYEANKNSLTYRYSDSQGTEHTVPGMLMPDGQLTSIESYYKGIGGDVNATQYVYDATNFRLREVSLGYTFRNVFGPSKNLSLSMVGRNLFFLFNEAPVDPDTSLSTQNSLGGVDVFNMPSSRSLGVALSVTF